MTKKGKVNKMARMSDEERARYLQHRADIEEEARRRKHELISRFIKNKLDKEEAYGRLNTAKINQQWRFILRKIKCKQMAGDIQNMSTSFNFLVERKNRLITTLIAATEDAGEQHRRAFQAHTENVSYFLSIGYQRLDKLQMGYDSQKNTVLENWDKEEINLMDEQEQAESKLKLIIYIQDRDCQNEMKQKEIQRATVKNDARLEHEEEMRALCRPKRLEVDMYWSKLREVYKNYLEEHNPIMNHYQILREKDEFYQKEIAKNDIQIQLATENMINLQQEWQKTMSITAEKLTRMAKRKDELSRKYQQFKRDSKMASTKSNQILAVMVNASEDAVQRLEILKEKINKLLQMAEICRKYEHEGDVLFQEETIDTASVNYGNLDGDMINECKDYNKMSKFLLKVNRAKVQTMCLKTEKAKLTKENIQLKNYIKRYLTELALKGNDRPLSMRIRTGAQKTDAKVLKRPVTCIEGALSIAVQHEMRVKGLAQRQKDLEIKAYPRVQCWM